jgi:hypothetical protein
MSGYVHTKKCQFIPQNRPMPEKCELAVYGIYHSCHIFVHMGVGGKLLYQQIGQNSIHGKNAIVYLPVVGLTEI